MPQTGSTWTAHAADTVKCLLDAGKSPIFRSISPCTYIYVQESQRFWDFVRIYMYERVKSLQSVLENNKRRSRKNMDKLHDKLTWILIALAMQIQIYHWNTKTQAFVLVIIKGRELKSSHGKNQDFFSRFLCQKFPMVWQPPSTDVSLHLVKPLAPYWLQ